ncbi:MAG: GAF domain-containing protein [Singulisphaera sp.]
MLDAHAALRRERGVAAMVQLVAADRVKQGSEGVRLVVQEMKAEEEARLERQMAARRASIARLYATFSVATALGLLLLGSGYFLIRRDVAARERAAGRAMAQYAVARTLAESRTLAEATPRLLEAVCRNTGWDAGTLWTVDRAADVLRFDALWHDPSVPVPQFEAASRERSFERGAGLVGRVWATTQPVWLEDATGDENFPRAAVAAEEGLRGAFAVPVLLGDEVLGVLEFFSRRSRRPDPDLIQVMTAVGRQVGQFLKRKRSESSLSRAEALKASMLDAALDAVITVDHEGRVLDFNPAAERIFGHAREAVLGRELAALIVPPALREGHRRGLVRYLETGEARVIGHRYEVPALRADGTEFPVELAVTRIPTDGPPLFTAYVRDITEPKRAEEDRARRAAQAVLGSQIGVALTRNEAPRDMLRACGEASVRHLDAAVARIWTLHPAGEILELQASAGMYTHIDGPHGRVPVGRFKIGLIAHERAPHLTNDVPNDPRVGDQEWARREGMVAFAGYPLVVGDRLIGVMALFARHTLAPDTLETLASIADTIAWASSARGGGGATERGAEPAAAGVDRRGHLRHRPGRQLHLRQPRVRPAAGLRRPVRAARPEHAPAGPPHPNRRDALPGVRVPDRPGLEVRRGGT